MKDASHADVVSRLLAATKSKTETDLAAALGVKPQSVSQAKKKGIPPQWLLDIALKYGTSVNWLVTGRGRQDVAAPGADVDLVPVPMVDAVLSAGHGSFQTSANSERKYAFRSDFLRRKGNVSQMVLMRVDGNSMEPRICSGDVVLIDQSQTALHPGQIYAVGVEDMVFLKEVSAVPGKVLLRSLNDAYPPLEVDTRGDLRDSVRIVGRCVWSCREL